MNTNQRLVRIVALVSSLALMLSLVPPGSQSVLAVSPNIVVSQVYGGGGNSGATLKNDFVELFNRGATSVSVAGWTVQYASTTGISWQKTTLSGSIAPGQYYLVQEAQGAGGTVNLPAPDAIGTIPMSATGGKVALVNNSTTLAGSCPTGVNVIDFIGYDGANCFEGSGPAAALNNTTAALRFLDGCVDTDNNASDFAASAPNPRNSASPFKDCSAPPPPQVHIHDIQGASHISSMNGLTVFHLPGVVTAKRSNGFYMQDPNPDGNDATSEGIFVFTSSGPTVNVGDAVAVNGIVTEFRSGGSASTNLTTTEIGSPSIVVASGGNPLPAPVILGIGGRIPPNTIIEDDATGSVETTGVFDPAADGIDFYESLEGMLVQVNNAVAVGPTRAFGGSTPNKEIPVVGDDGADIGPGLRTPRGGIVIQPGDFNPERIILNDLIAGGPTLPTVNVGDRFTTPIVGVMDYSFGNYKLEVSEPMSVASGGLTRQTAASTPAYQLSAATFNVENLAPTDPATKFQTLAGQIVNNLRSPDLVAIEEIQDNSGAVDNGVVDATTTWDDLIAAIQTAGGPTYQFREIDPVDDQDGGAPGGNIRQGFLFRTDSGLSFVDRPGGNSTTADAVVGAGASTHLLYSPGRIDPANSAFNDSRKPLAGEFMFKGNKLFVVANHFNSKSGDDPLFGRFQPPFLSSEAQRDQQAQVVHDFITTLVAADPNANVVVLGDLNDFQFSNPLSVLKSGVLNDLVETLLPSERYTYVFDGNSQTLDHILIGNSTFTRPFGYQVVHVNSEFADQASDHEPQVARLCVDNTPPALTVTASPDRLWPPDHLYVTVTAATSVSDNADPNPAIKLVSVTSNEPDIGLGDGDMPNDIVIVNDHTFDLRAERSGTGSGRVYTITYQATDACGNNTVSTATVTVPHDLGQ